MPTYTLPEPMPRHVPRNHWLWPYIQRDLFWKKYEANPFSGQMPTDLMQRPGFGTAGRTWKLNINSYEVSSWPTSSVYQYDVSEIHSYIILKSVLILYRLSLDQATRNVVCKELYGSPDPYKMISAQDSFGMATRSAGT